MHRCCVPSICSDSDCMSAALYQISSTRVQYRVRASGYKFYTRVRSIGVIRSSVRSDAPIADRSIWPHRWPDFRSAIGNRSDRKQVQYNADPRAHFGMLRNAFPMPTQKKYSTMYAFPKRTYKTIKKNACIFSIFQHCQNVCIYKMQKNMCIFKCWPNIHA